MGVSFHFRRARVGLLALGGVLVVMALGPATASATHFTGSTKTCAEQNFVTKTFECVLTLTVVRTEQGQEKIVIDIDSPVGAEFSTAPTRTGGTCPPTTVSLADSTTVELSPAPTGSGTCTIVLQETLTSDDFGEVCQLPDFLPVGINFPEFRVCAQLLPPPLPSAKEQCKKGGFRNFGGAFRNQGDCVSFVATQGKNEPGKNVSRPEGP